MDCNGLTTIKYTNYFGTNAFCSWLKMTASIKPMSNILRIVPSVSQTNVQDTF